jgi:hypothetical protein
MGLKINGKRRDLTKNGPRLLHTLKLRSSTKAVLWRKIPFVRMRNWARKRTLRLAEIGQIEIPLSPLEIRCEGVWRQICTENLRQFTTSDEKRALFNYLVIVSNRALELLDEVQSDDEFCHKTARRGGANS